MILNEQHKIILNHFKGKSIGEWTPQEELERDLAENIHYYELRQRLPELVKAAYLEFSRHMSSYKISQEGRRTQTYN